MKRKQVECFRMPFEPSRQRWTTYLANRPQICASARKKAEAVRLSALPAYRLVALHFFDSIDLPRIYFGENYE